MNVKKEAFRSDKMRTGGKSVEKCREGSVKITGGGWGGSTTPLRVYEPP